MTTAMRSSSLQKKFPNVYRDFFTPHDLIISAPHTLRWGYSLSRGGTAIGVQQQLPAKMYCGAILHEHAYVHLEGFTLYNSITNQFEYYEPTQILKEKQLMDLSQTIQELLQEYGYKAGVSLQLLCEYKKGEGFGFMGSMFVALATMLLLLGKKIKPESLTGNLSSNHSTYLLIQQVALYLDKRCLSQSGGASIAAALMPQGLPIAQISQPNVNGIPSTSPEKQGISPLRCFFGLQELYQTTISVEELPIDYGVISFGLTHDCGTTKRAYQQSYRMLTDSYDRLMELYQQRAEEISPAPLIGTPPSNTWDNYLYAHLLEFREQILQAPNDEHAVEGFIQTIMDCGLYHLMVENDMHEFFQIYTRFDELKSFSQEKLGLMPISSTQAGGSILFVTRRGASQSTMSQLLERLREKHRHVHFSYLSWRDGFSSCGVQVEQYLSNNIFSPYVVPGSVLFEGGDGRCYVGPHHDIVQTERKGVLLDQVYGKVYLDGQKTTYKQLRSQSGTTEILSILLKSVGQYVAHSKFPASSYSNNKNEMIGKILSPISNLMKEKYGITLPIECNGGVYDFEVKLAKNPQGLLQLVSKVEEAGKEIRKRPM